MAQRRIVIGIVSHVDAGKTTAIEAMLFAAGAVKKQGRVDHGDSALDYDGEERRRGITIYAKEAHLTWRDTDIYIIDTPGHVDFSAEMERALGVLDLAVVIINGRQGVQAHTETIWGCLAHYHVPCVVFINKMDIAVLTKETLTKELADRCPGRFIDWTDAEKEEKLALVNDDMLEEYASIGKISFEKITSAVMNRQCFPVLSGALLKNEGTTELLDLIASLAVGKVYPADFGAVVYKISRDDQNTRLTHVRITGGSLKPKQKLSETDKVDQIRLYTGSEYEVLTEAVPGTVCVLKGPENIRAGQGLGFESDRPVPVLNAFLNYDLLYPADCDKRLLVGELDRLSDQDPLLGLNVDDETDRITLAVMGDIQKEILQKKIFDRTGIAVGFAKGEIIFRETIQSAVEGAGHFEPLRHYGEVHVRLEPLKRGAGIVVTNACLSQETPLSFQKAIIECLNRKKHKGILTGALLTDVRIILAGGKGNLKHTSGGDFRQASIRAVRQALMKAPSVLLEPYVDFSLTLPREFLSNVIYDLEMRQCRMEVADAGSDNVRIIGRGPLRTMMNYQNDLTALTKGRGVFSSRPAGYDVCAKSDEIIAKKGYDPLADRYNSPSSIFFIHGSSVEVPWDKADELMHMKIKSAAGQPSFVRKKSIDKTVKLNPDELVEKAGGNNRNRQKDMAKKRARHLAKEKPKTVMAKPAKPVCYIIDGYNMVYGFSSLKELAEEDYGVARERLIDMMKAYHAFVRDKMILVFDAYKVKEGLGSTVTEGSFSLVYTKQGETADAWIEKQAALLAKDYQVWVASGDGLIQSAVFAKGAERLSPREMENRYRLMMAEFAAK